MDNRERDNYSPEQERVEEPQRLSYNEAKERHKATVITFVAVIIIVVLVGLAGFIFYSPHEEVYIGRAEVPEVRISGKVPGRITEFLVGEGDWVQEGDTLVRIYSPEVLAKKLQAEAADKATSAINKGIMGGTSVEIRQTAYDAWMGAKAALEAGEKAFDRAQRLYKEGVIPAQKFDEAEAKIKALRAAESAAKSQYNLAQKGLFSQDKEASEALKERTEGLLAEVDAYSKEAALISPISGMVADIFPHRGELVGTGAPIMNVADMSAFEVLFTIREDKLNSLRKGTLVRGTIPALGGEAITLRVTKLKDLGSYAVWKATKPTGEVDVRTFEVTMVPDRIPQDFLPGMSVVLDKGQVK